MPQVSNEDLETAIEVLEEMESYYGEIGSRMCRALMDDAASRLESYQQLHFE
jgi:hypothetical protein